MLRTRLIVPPAPQTRENEGQVHVVEVPLLRSLCLRVRPTSTDDRLVNYNVAEGVKSTAQGLHKVCVCSNLLCLR